MTRIYITEIDTESSAYDPGYSEPRRRAGYFTEESATYWHGNKQVFDGANLADVNTRDQNRGEGLYRTAQGRWVLRTWSNWQGETDTFSYADEQTARDWLLFNDYENAVAEQFGDVQDERGPGRPEIGAPVQVRLGDLLPQVDAWAAARGIKRAEATRQLIAAGLTAPQLP